MESYTLWPSVTGFSLGTMFSGPSVLQPVLSVLRSFVRLNNIPLCGRTSFCVSICQLMDVWVVSTFSAIVINATVGICVRAFVWVCVFSSLGSDLGVELLGRVIRQETKSLWLSLNSVVLRAQDLGESSP